MLIFFFKTSEQFTSSRICKIIFVFRVSADDGTLRKSGSKIATNGSLQIHKKHQNQSPVRQASVVSPVQSWHEDIRDMGLNEEVVDDVDIDSEENEHYASVSDQHHYSTLRKGSQSSSGPSRYQRNSHFSQFSRLPPGDKINQTLISCVTLFLASKLNTLICFSS